MAEYKKASYCSYVRILGLKGSSSDLTGLIHECASIPVIDRPKFAPKLLDSLQLRLFEETMTAGSIYNSISKSYEGTEYSLKPIIL